MMKMLKGELGRTHLYSRKVCFAQIRGAWDGGGYLRTRTGRVRVFRKRTHLDNSFFHVNLFWSCVKKQSDFIRLKTRDWEGKEPRPFYSWPFCPSADSRNPESSFLQERNLFNRIVLHSFLMNTAFFVRSRDFGPRNENLRTPNYISTSHWQGC